MKLMPVQPEDLAGYKQDMQEAFQLGAAEGGIGLIGVEGQSVGPEDGPMAVHKVLLGAGTVLLEGIRLGCVAQGVYFLNAAPICLSGSDGAPCRAVLLEKEACREFGG